MDMKIGLDDVETLIEAMGDWETMGNQEFELLRLIKNVPMPSEDSEAFESINALKLHFRNREQEIKASRLQRQEQAIMIKAKLFSVRRAALDKKKDLDIDALFGNLIDSTHASPTVPAQVMEELPVTFAGNSELEDKLKSAEYFIYDMGVWQYYQDFLGTTVDMTAFDNFLESAGRK